MLFPICRFLKVRGWLRNGRASSLGMKTTTALAESERESERRPESKKKAGRLSQFFQKPLQEKDKKTTTYKAVLRFLCRRFEAAIREIHLNFSAHNLFSILNTHTAVTTTVNNLLLCCFLALLVLM